MSLSPATFYDDNGVVRLQGQLDGGGGTPDVRLATTAVSSAEILALHTTPKAVTPVPAANHGQMVLLVWTAYHFLTAAYTGFANLSVTPNYTGHNNFTATVSDSIGFAFDAVSQFVTVQYNPSSNANEYDHADLLGAPWALAADIAIGGGGGTLTVYCVYVDFAG